MTRTKTHFKNEILTTAQSCSEYYIYMMELLYTVKIFKEYKWTNSDLHNKATCGKIADLTTQLKSHKL